jgi:xylulokinase
MSQSLGGLGASLEWLLQRCWPAAEGGAEGRQAAFAALDAELAGTTPGGNGLYFAPLTGGHSAPAGDQRGGLWGLRLDHSRAGMARAVMEGAAYELRWALEPIREAGMPVERMWMIGGAAHSPLWPAIVADVCGVPLVLPGARPEVLPEPIEGPSRRSWHGPAAGAAILAGVGVGAFESLEEGLARFQRPARLIEPDQARVAIYDECFAGYQQLYGAMNSGR